MTTGLERGAARGWSLWLLVCALCVPAPSHTADAQPAWGLAQLMASLSAVKSARGKFVERKQLAMLSAPLELSGALVYTAPGHLEKHTLRPSPESMILDGDHLVIERIEGGPRRIIALADFPVLRAFVESLRSTLAGDLATLQRFYEVRLSGSEGRWRLVLRPSDPKMREFVVEIRVEGAGTWVSAVSILEAGGDRSTMTITRDAS
jgi:hypothetical protein